VSNCLLGRYLSLPEINLLIQTLILIMFLTSIFFKIKQKFFIHGTLMLVAVISAIVDFLLLSPGIMSEKSSSISDYINQFFSSPITLVPFVLHVSVTVLAVLLGVWVVGTWRFRSNLYCAPKKKIMRLIFVLWILGYIVGILFYLIINTNLIV